MLDYSYAGYGANERPIPNAPQAANVKDFGAKGDGVTDDTNAFLAAIAYISSGPLYIPAGKYRITKRLVINKNIVLRGAGREQTVLYFPYNLAQVYGNVVPPGYSISTLYSYGPGWIHFIGYDPLQFPGSRDTTTGEIHNDNLLARVAADAKRGDYSVKVDTTTGINLGDWVLLAMDGGMDQIEDFNGYYVNPLASCIDGLCTMPWKGGNLYRFPVRVAAIDRSSNGLTFDRPLPYNYSLAWERGFYVYRYGFTMRDVGVENLAVEFPLTRYPGHFKEQGYNGIFFEAAVDCWVRNVRITNFDVGLNLNRTHFCSLDGVVTTTTGSRGSGGQGHHGIDVMRSSDVAVTNFQILATTLHDLSTEWFNVGVVFANGMGVDLNMDHHREMNYGTLWSNITVGAGTRPFLSSGNANWRGLHSSSFTTFWNIRTASGAPVVLPEDDFGPLLNFVGIASYPTTIDPALYPLGWSLEYMAANTVQPRDLYAAMVATRNSRIKRSRRRALAEEEEEAVAPATTTAVSAADGNDSGDEAQRGDAGLVVMEKAGLMPHVEVLDGLPSVGLQQEAAIQRFAAARQRQQHHKRHRVLRERHAGNHGNGTHGAMHAAMMDHDHFEHNELVNGDGEQEVVIEGVGLCEQQAVARQVSKPGVAAFVQAANQ